MGHQTSNIHLFDHHCRSASINKSVIEPGHKLAHLGPQVSNNSRSILRQLSEFERIRSHSHITLLQIHKLSHFCFPQFKRKEVIKEDQFELIPSNRCINLSSFL